MTDSGTALFVLPSEGAQSIYRIASKYTFPWLSLPDKPSSWGTPNPGHLSTAGNLIFSQCLACVFQPWFHVRLPLGLQMYRSPPPPFRPPESESGLRFSLGEGEKQGLGQSQFSRTSAHYPVSPGPHSFLASHLIEVWATFLVVIPKQMILKYALLFFCNSKNFDWIYTNCYPLWVMTWEK